MSGPIGNGRNGGCISRLAGKRATTWKKPHRRQPIDALQQPFEALGSGAHAAMYGSHWPQDWLSSVSVPDILRRCDCGWPKKTACHVLVMQCRTYEKQRPRAEPIRKTGSKDFRVILISVASARAAARWFVRPPTLWHIGVI